MKTDILIHFKKSIGGEASNSLIRTFCMCNVGIHFITFIPTEIPVYELSRY